MLPGLINVQVNLKYMKKSARDEARAAFKQQAKAAKRSKLDPDQVLPACPHVATALDS